MSIARLSLHSVIYNIWCSTGSRRYKLQASPCRCTDRTAAPSRALSGSPPAPGVQRRCRAAGTGAPSPPSPALPCSSDRSPLPTEPQPQELRRPEAPQVPFGGQLVCPTMAATSGQSAGCCTDSPHNKRRINRRYAELQGMEEE